MEVLVLWVILMAATKAAAVDVAYAVRGKPSPRQQRAVARTRAREAAIQAKVAKRSAPPSPFRAYCKDLWDDTFADRRAKHVERRVSRYQRQFGRPSHSGAARRYFAGLKHDASRAVWSRWDRGWDNADRKRRLRSETDLGLVPVPAAPSASSPRVPSRLVPLGDGRTDLRFGDDPNDPTGVRSCGLCHGTSMLDGRMCPGCLARQEARNAHWDSQAGGSSPGPDATAVQRPAADTATNRARQKLGLPPLSHPDVAALERQNDYTSGITVPADATRPCPCGEGQQVPVLGSIHADEGYGFASVATACTSPGCGILSGHDWVLPDAEYEKAFGHEFGADDPEDPEDPAWSANPADPQSPDGPNRPVTPTEGNPPTERNPLMSTTAVPTGEVTGLQSAINFAAGTAAAAEGAQTSIETTIANLEAAEVTGPAISHLASAQEHFAAASAAMRSVERELGQHTGVSEAYAATGGHAGSKQHVTSE